MPIQEREIRIFRHNTLTLRIDLDLSALDPATDFSTYHSLWWFGELATYGLPHDRAARALVQKNSDDGGCFLQNVGGTWAMFVRLAPADTVGIDPDLYHQEAALTSPTGDFYTVTTGPVRLVDTAIGV